MRTSEATSLCAAGRRSACCNRRGGPTPGTGTDRYYGWVGAEFVNPPGRMWAFQDQEWPEGSVRGVGLARGFKQRQCTTPLLRSTNLSPSPRTATRGRALQPPLWCACSTGGQHAEAQVLQNRRTPPPRQLRKLREDGEPSDLAGEHVSEEECFFRAGCVWIGALSNKLREELLCCIAPPAWVDMPAGITDSLWAFSIGPKGSAGRLASGWSMQELAIEGEDEPVEGEVWVLGTPKHFDIHRRLKAEWLAGYILQVWKKICLGMVEERWPTKLAVRLSHRTEQVVFEYKAMPAHMFIFVQEESPALCSQHPHSDSEMEDLDVLAQLEGRLAALSADHQACIQRVTCPGSTSAGGILPAYIGHAGSIDKLLSNMRLSNIVKIWPAHIFLESHLSMYNNVPFTADSEYDHVACWEDPVAPTQVFSVQRVGRAMVLYSAARGGSSLPLTILFCAEGYIWVGELRSATGQLMLLVGRYGDEDAAAAIDVMEGFTYVRL